MFQLNEEPLTGQSGPVNLAGKMPPRKKTPEKGERKESKTSSRKKGKATVIRDEPERNLFLECLQSINQPPTASDPPPKGTSAQHSRSTSSQSTPSPSTRAPSPKRKEECQHNQHSAGDNPPKRSEIFKIHTTLNKDGQNENFQEWLRERAAGHTHHDKYIEWLTERIDDNRQLTREAEEQQRGRRLLAGLAGWGKGLNARPITSLVTMTMENQGIISLQSVIDEAPAPAEEQMRDPMTSTDGPLLSGSSLLTQSCCLGQSRSFRRISTKRELSQTVRTRASEPMQELIQLMAVLERIQTTMLITMAHRAKRTINHPVHGQR